MANDEVSGEREPTAAEVLAWRRDDVFLPEVEALSNEFPRLRNISAAFTFGGVVLYRSKSRRAWSGH
ncbi:hypothetical protein [Kibdelosporangium aridum]|uniref:Uncharacterized protein n=1 Tax=Kibdelosporangium aridum TaxID=2030 RepID=A0A1Y5Y9B7_KIBAR|nr:hypothetical protein [Kibdelosporangium aridum]SMD27488.1 hypothetical protein SAMN05661093_11095 [Kibdelosporangium aridum]